MARAISAKTAHPKATAKRPLLLFNLHPRVQRRKLGLAVCAFPNCSSNAQPGFAFLPPAPDAPSNAHRAKNKQKS